jgi:hypothetical protein
MGSLRTEAAEANDNKHVMVNNSFMVVSGMRRNAESRVE